MTICSIKRSCNQRPTLLLGLALVVGALSYRRVHIVLASRVSGRYLDTQTLKNQPQDISQNVNFKHIIDFFLLYPNSYLRIRVLARISKMPVQNSNFKISARPD